MNENGGRSTNILLTVIGIATLLVVVTGATFAYFAAIIEGNDNPTSVYIKAANQGATVTQVETEQLELTGIYPRTDAWAHQIVGFTVEGDESDATQTINWSLIVETNDWASSTTDKDDIKYTFTNRTSASEDGNLYSAKYTTVEGYTETENTASTKTTVPAAGTYNVVTATRPHKNGGDIIYDLKVYYVEDATRNQNNGTSRTVRLKMSGTLTD